MIKKDKQWLKKEIADRTYWMYDELHEGWSLGTIEEVNALIDEMELPNAELEDYQLIIEKPEVPKYVADWIEENEEYLTVYGALAEISEYSKGTKYYNIRRWVFNSDFREDSNSKTIEEFTTAYMYGYTVKEEPKYEVRCKGELLLTYYTNIGEVVSVNRWDNHLSKKAGRDWKLRHELTEQEIKDYDERYWAFAEPVEELEE